MDNQFDTNRVHVFSHGADPTELTHRGSYETGGSGYPLGLDGPANVLASQFAIIRHQDWVFACNAGGNSVTTFKVLPSGALSRASVTPTEGVFPVSLAAHNQRLCVVTAESSGAEAGMGGHLECYRIETDGSLHFDYVFQADASRLFPVNEGVPFPPGSADGVTTYYTGTPGGSTNPRNNGPIVAGRTPAQVSFTEEGDALIVTVKSSGIFVFPIETVYNTKRLTGPKIFDLNYLHSASVNNITNIFGSPGGLPFSFVFQKLTNGDRVMHVTEPIGIDGTIPGGGGVISFRLTIDQDVPLEQITGIVIPDRGGALTTPCWMVRAPGDNIVWSANTNEGSITTFEIDEATGLPTSLVARTLLPAGPPGSTILPDVAAGGLFRSPRGALALDLAVSGCGEFLYVLDPGFNRVVAFSTHPDGSLSLIGDAASGLIPIPDGGIPPGVMGLAASPASRTCPPVPGRG